MNGMNEGCLIEDPVSGETYAVLRFKRKELLYDIENVAYVEGHVMPDEAEHARHSVIDIGAEGNVDRVTRMMDLAVAKCREMLYSWSRRGVTSSEISDDFKESGEYTILLRLPAEFSQTTLELMEAMIHDYIVSSVLADWCGIAYPDKADYWYAKRAGAEDELRTMLQTRMTKVRRKSHWV